MVLRNPDIDVSNYRYDPETGIVVRALPDGSTKPIGHKDSGGYLRARVEGYDIAVHRLGWRLHFGVWPELGLDHRDKDKTNNRIGNLREATDAMNCLNVGKQSNNTTGFKGVAFDKKALSKPWRGRIIVGGKYHNLGCFDTAEEAAAAYDEAANRLHGDFADFNGLLTPERLSVVARRRLNTVGVRGVTALESAGRRVYKASIFHAGKAQYLGLHRTARWAGIAYDEAAVRLEPLGKRRLNYPILQLAKIAFYPPYRPPLRTGI